MRSRNTRSTTGSTFDPREEDFTLTEAETLPSAASSCSFSQDAPFQHCRSISALIMALLSGSSVGHDVQPLCQCRHKKCSFIHLQQAADSPGWSLVQRRIRRVNVRRGESGWFVPSLFMICVVTDALWRHCTRFNYRMQLAV